MLIAVDKELSISLTGSGDVFSEPADGIISIGSGGPFGAEGPIIMTGGAIGSLLAQYFHLTAGERKTLLVAGAVAGGAVDGSLPG